MLDWLNRQDHALARQDHALARQELAIDHRFDVLPPAPWAATALRLCLGLAGTLLTTLALWSLAPPSL